MKRWLVTVLFAMLGTAAHALPTVANVEAEVQKGNYAQAQSMMHEVVIAKPGSAKAHYIYAEILAHNDKFSDAAQEAALAKQLDSSLKFTNPDKFKAFEQLLERKQQRASRTSSRGGSSLGNLGPRTSVSPTVSAQPLHRSEEQSPGMPAWVWLVGLAALALLAWRMMSKGRVASSSAAMPAGAPYGSASGYAPAPSYGPTAGGVAPSGVGGLMGVGLAAAGGLAAGMLAEKYLEHGHEQRRDDNFLDRDSFTSAAPPMDGDARALEDRGVDFGTGGDWDAAGSADSGTVDPGGGSGDDGGW